jgi:16S rRNA (cytosine1402-N4)-methyltransferase
MERHIPVMVDEVIEYLKPRENQNFIDCTVGNGGHAEAILKKTAPKGKLIGLDLDPQAIKISQERLKKFQHRILLQNKNYKKLKQIFYANGLFNNCHGLLLDLGLSSTQLADHKRGFSFKSQGEILMNFGSDYNILAKDIINNWTEEELIKIFREYGDEEHASQIARIIVQQKQKQKQISTAYELADLILQVSKNRLHKKIHPATKVFQALRIVVNDEPNNLKEVLPQALEIISNGGRLAVISFHSLEDKIVKDYFRQEARDCLCPPEFPKCQCQHQAKIKIITKKVIIPGPEEIKENPRARSAKLRVAEKI